jgi:ABC-type branched-subunit amino acid transport system permease subunit
VLALSAPNFVLVQGLFYGLGYGLLALGLVLVYRTNRVLNFAQGQIGVIAAVFLVKLTADFKFNYWFALVLSIGLAAFVGALSELILRRLFNRPRVLVMVATIGLSYVLLALTALPFIRPSNLYKPVPVPFDLSFSLGPFIITPTEVLTLIVAPIVTVALVLAVRFTSWGLSMRAMSENADSARLSGVWIRRTSTLTWTVAGALSAFTAILNAPNQTSALTQALSPDLLLYALTAALIGAMINLTVAFVAGVGMGLFLEILAWNVPSPAKQQLIVFVVVMVVLLIRVGALRKGARTGERSTWAHGAVTTMRFGADQLRRRVSTSGVWLLVIVSLLLPFVLSVGNDVLFSQICIYSVVALSLTMLTGWAGQVSLGQFGLVAVGALVAVHLGTSVPLPLVMIYGGAVTALVAILVGLPALRMPGLFLAVTTLAFAIFMQNAVLATPCITVPGLNKTLCTGLPNPAYTFVERPSLFGISLASQRSFAWFSLGVLLLSVFMVRVWRDKGVARRLVAVRDNELTAAAIGIPILRTKLLAFGLSGFMAGYAGVCFAFATQQLNNTDITFDPTTSFVIISMVVIGGLGSIPGAILGALYLEGLPAIFGSNQTIQFITSGLGLILFILYLPGGLAELLHRTGDLVTMGIRNAQARLLARGAGPPVAPTGTVGDMTTSLAGDGREQ